MVITTRREGFKMKAELLEEYEAVIDGQKVKVKRYSTPKIELDEKEQKRINFLFDKIQED
jgi:hypothetical protein